MARRFTRQAFHDLVWTKTMVQLVKFAISDVALSKICRKHTVLTPSVGWWAKKAAGNAVKRTLSPKVKGVAVIDIACADFTDAALAEASETARILASVGGISSAAAMHR